MRKKITEHPFTKSFVATFEAYTGRKDLLLFTQEGALKRGTLSDVPQTDSCITIDLPGYKLADAVYDLYTKRMDTFQKLLLEGKSEEIYTDGYRADFIFVYKPGETEEAILQTTAEAGEDERGAMCYSVLDFTGLDEATCRKCIETAQQSDAFILVIINYDPELFSDDTKRYITTQKYLGDGGMTIVSVEVGD